MRLFLLSFLAQALVYLAQADNHDCNCPTYSDQVCGGNLNTYENMCQARCAGTNVIWFDSCEWFIAFLVFCIGFAFACLCCCVCAMTGMVNFRGGLFGGLFRRRQYMSCPTVETVSPPCPPQPMPMPVYPTPMPVPLPQPVMPAPQPVYPVVDRCDPCEREKAGISVVPGTSFAARGVLVGKDANYDGRITANETGFIPTGGVVSGGVAVPYAGGVAM